MIYTVAYNSRPRQFHPRADHRKQVNDMTYYNVVTLTGCTQPSIPVGREGDLNQCEIRGKGQGG